MLVSLAWLRSLCPIHASAEEVADALTERGLTVDGVMPSGNDTVIEIDVPANRPDCLGHRGVARELSAAFDAPLLPPAAAPAGRGESVGKLVRVRIEDPELCPRYTARVVRSVRVGPSPESVVTRLKACGLRSINNVVDASNLVLLELGNPIHFFDLALIRQAAIIVRRARPGEVLKTLDGVDRRLEPDMLVIADGDRVVALAGVIGGADSEIHSATRDVLIEAAYFQPNCVRSTARRLGLSTDASHRFERDVDPEGVLAAQELAVRLLEELAGGQPAPGLLDAYPKPRVRPTLGLRPERIRRVVGYQPSAGEIASALRSLQLGVQLSDDGRFRVKVPSWRVDLQREVDLVEEVARHFGYDRIPAGAATGTPISPPRPALTLEERVRDLAAHLGFHEGFSYAMVGTGEDDPFVARTEPPALSLTNPIAEPLTDLRRSILPGLIRAADLNLRRGIQDVRLFEVGRVFLPRQDDPFPLEPLRLGLVWCGASEPTHWSSSGRPVALHDVAGAVEYLIRALRPTARPRRWPGSLGGLHPGQSMTWTLPSGPEELARCGALHPAIRQARDLPQEVFLAEIDLDLLGRLPAQVPMHSPLPRVPSVTRDLSLVVKRATTFEEVLGALQEVSPPAAVRMDVVDRYEGKPLGPDEISLTVRVILHPQERTLTDEETEAYRTKLVRALEAKVGVKLRG